MAIIHWFIKTYPNRKSNLNIDRVEPSRQMRDTASYILKAYKQKLEESLAENVRPVISARCDPAIKDLSKYASTANAEKLDLCLFCHTFSNDSYAKRQDICNDIALIADNHLGTEGILIFLTPDVSPGKPGEKYYSKVLLIDTIAERLSATKFRHGKYEKSDMYPFEDNWANSNRQTLIMNIRKAINKECPDSSILPIFEEENPKDNHPYYRLTSRVDIFYR